MASRSLSSTCSLDGQSLDLRDGDATTRLSRSDVSENMSHEAQDRPRDNRGPIVHQGDPDDNFKRNNERTSNTRSSYQPSPAVSFSRSVSRETNTSLLSGSRRTPIRAVFHDLPTAYLSITSGFGRSRSQNTSGSLQEVRFEEGSISRQDSRPLSKCSGGLLELKQLPAVAAYASRLYSNNTHGRIPNDKDSEHHITRSTARVPPSDSVDHDEAAHLPAGINNTVIPPFSLDISDGIFCSIPPSLSPEQTKSPEASNGAQLSKSLMMRNVTTDNDHHKLTHQYSNPESTASLFVSVQEGGTVDNIYRHGTPRLDLDGFLSSKSSLALSSQSDGQNKPSALSVRKQRRVNRLMSGPPSQPPLYALPALPTPALTFNRFPSSKMQMLGRSSAYRNTKVRLDTTKQSSLATRKPTLSRSEGRPDLRLQNIEFGLRDDTKLSLTTSKSNNTFRLCSHPPLDMPQPSHADFIYDIDHNFENISCNRKPLEREVSQALRRVSGFSVFSNGSTSSVDRDEDIERNAPSFKFPVSHKKSSTVDTPPSEPRNFDNGAQGASTVAQWLYDDHTTPLDWATPHQPNAVCASINPKEVFPSSQLELRLASTVLPLGRRDDAAIDDPEDMDDWETVGESRFGTEFKDSQEIGKPFQVSTIYRTGSSLANTSNDGTTSPYDVEIDEYGSTERITQHASTIQYSGDYRLQELNRSPIPNFPPRYREHKVNGYLADLTRRRTPHSPFNHVPRPLESPHANPFISPPPEDFSTPTARRMLFHKGWHRARKPNHFPPSKTNGSRKENKVTGQDRASISSALTLTTLTERERTYRKLNWNAESPGPIPTLSHSKRQFLSPINPVGRPDRSSSWTHLMVLERGDKTEDYNPDGTPDEEPRTLTLPESTESNWNGQMQTDGCIELKRFSEHRCSTNPREHQPLVKGPPGALYQGIARSQQDTNIGSSDAHGKSTRIPSRYSSSKDYPTNALRPLSLRANRPVAPAESENHGHLPAIHKSGYTYRSPHAPPRRLSWQQLYTEAQLKTMQEAANAERVNDTPLVSNNGTFGQITTEEEPTYRNMHEGRAFSQSLTIWTRESSAQMDLCDKQRMFSNVALLLCVLFPPLLVLFALGKLDKMVVWWSRGEISAFADKQKKLAKILSAVWGFAFFVGFIIALVFRIVPSNPTT